MVHDHRPGRPGLGLLVGLVLLIGCASASSSPALTHKRLAVVMDHAGIRGSHSMFFQALEARGHTLDYRLAEDETLKLLEFGEPLYDGLVLFAPEAESLASGIDAKAVIAFIDAGRDVLLAASSQLSELVREIATEVGVDFDEAGTAVIDHVNYSTNRDNDRTLVTSARVTNASIVLGPAAGPGAAVLFRGVAMSVSPESELVLRALTAEPSAFSHRPGAALAEAPLVAGTDIVLVAAVQARNNARVTVSGSLDMFSDAFATSIVTWPAGRAAEASINRAFCAQLAAWAFHERGHLRAKNLRHHKIGAAGTPAVYRINDKLEVEVDVSEFVNGHWTPFTGTDLQVEFRMLDPYVRKTMSHDGKGHYSARFAAPDAYGVFKFSIDYRRPGYTWLSLSQVVPVRPFRHTEYERFIVAAGPYYASAFAMMAGFFAFGFVFLYSKN